MSKLIIELHWLKTQYEAQNAWYFAELIQIQIDNILAKENE